MSSGYIRLSRKFFDGTYWSQSRTFSPAEAWLDLVQMARFEVEPAIKLLPNGRKITVERGEVHASLRYLSVRWGWSKGKVQRFIGDNPDVGHRTGQGETILRLCNYDTYNPPPDPGGTPNGTATGHRRDTDGTKLIKENKGNNEKEIITPIIPLSGDCAPAVSKMEMAEIKDTPQNGKKGAAGFVPPALAEVAAYCAERGGKVNAAQWVDYYTANGWKVGKNPMRDWKAAVRTWENNRFQSPKNSTAHHPAANYDNNKTFESW